MTGQAANDLAKIAAKSRAVASPSQTLILFALVARHGAAPQNDLGVPLEAADREALEQSGVIETTKREHNALWLSLTDKGWAWAQDHTSKALPQNHLVLHHMMCRIGEHLERTGETLREMIGAPPKRLDAETSS